MHVVSMALTARSGEHMRPCHSQFLWLYCTVSFQDLASAWSMIKNDTNSLRYNCIMHWRDMASQLLGHVSWFASTVSIDKRSRACISKSHCSTSSQQILSHDAIAGPHHQHLHWLNNTMAYYMSLLVLTVSVTIIKYTKHHYRLPLYSPS